MNKKASIDQNLPEEAAEFIKLIIKKMRYRKKVRQEVMAELAAHFEDQLRDCKTTEEKQTQTKQLIEEFGDPQLLAVLLRRAKKRCRTLKQKIVIRTLQVIGIIILYIIIRFIYLMSGSPTISVDYVDWLNNIVRADRPENLNAQTYYSKAIELYVKCPPAIEQKLGKQSDYNDVEMEILSKWLVDNQPAMVMFRQGASKPYYWLTYRDDDKSGNLKDFDKMPKGYYMSAAVVENIMEFLPAYRKLAYALKENIIYQTDRGQFETALNDCLILQKFASHLQGRRLLIEQLVGIAVEGVGRDKIFEILRDKNISLEILRDFYNKYADHLDQTDNSINFEAEKAFWYNLIQYGFTDDGKGSGRVLKNGLPLVISNNKKSIWQFLSGSFPDRKEVVKTMEEYFEKEEQLLKKTPWQFHNSDNDIKELNEIGKKCFMLQMEWPQCESMNQLNWRIKIERTAVLTVIAVLLYEEDTGSYPDSLQTLVTASYLKQVPTDAFSDKPLVYRKTDNNFTLYSVGLNFIDDGGQMGKDKGKPKSWADNGDTVFWPVNK